jgi:hypothetical protein
MRYKFICILFISVNCFAQVNHEIKIMSWNILNFPDPGNNGPDTTARCPSYREVVNYVNPDILVTMENTSNNSIPWFLNQVMNANDSSYKAGQFINGYDTDNGLFYRDSLFTFVSNVPINTNVRDINQFTLIYKNTGDTILIYAVHLKAGQTDVVERTSEVAALRNVTNALPPGKNFIVAGDFNFYGDNETAYYDLLQDNGNDDGNFNDIWNLTGVWNNPAYSFYHTQSTRYSLGGMDDRFDMILYSNGIKNPTGMYFIPGSYTNIGNDGNHYNESVNYGFNSAVPANIANALYVCSDHLPVSINVQIGPTAGVEELESKIQNLKVYPSPLTENSSIYFTVKDPCKIKYSISDLSGRIVEEKSLESYFPGNFQVPVDLYKFQNSGFYMLSMIIDNSLVTRKLILIK